MPTDLLIMEAAKFKTRWLTTRDLFHAQPLTLPELKIIADES